MKVMLGRGFSLEELMRPASPRSWLPPSALLWTTAAATSLWRVSRRTSTGSRPTSPTSLCSPSAPTSPRLATPPPRSSRPPPPCWQAHALQEGCCSSGVRHHHRRHEGHQGLRQAQAGAHEQAHGGHPQEARGGEGQGGEGRHEVNVSSAAATCNGASLCPV